MQLPTSMVLELVVRFIAGGAIVSFFAAIGDMIQPKKLAGIFGAAPSVALVSLTLTYLKSGESHVVLEGRSLILGSAALLCYGLVVGWALRGKMHAAVVAGAAWGAWLAVALGLWALLLR